MLYLKYLWFKNEHFSNMQLYGNLFLIFFKNNVKSLDVRSFVKLKTKSGISPALLTPVLRRGPKGRTSHWACEIKDETMSI